MVFAWLLFQNGAGNCKKGYLLSAVMGCLNDRSRIATFFEKLAHFFRFVRKIRVITAQTLDSKKIENREWNFLTWDGIRESGRNRDAPIMF